jgi:hypothetical protein
MILLELFNSVKNKYKVTHDDSNLFETSATIKDRVIIFSAARKGADTGIGMKKAEKYGVASYWGVVFLEKTDGDILDFHMTNSGGSIEVMAMVKDSLLELIRKHKPEALVFTAASKSRIGVYERMIQKLMPSTYELIKQQTSPYEVEFVIKERK